MTSRQARKQRREQERKAAKLIYQQSRLTPAPDCRALDDEFSADFIAEANAARERVARRAAINRANAAYSTGPKSPEGKLASSHNSLKHGLASGQVIIPGEDPAAYEALLQDFLNEHQPASTTEELLIHEMAQSFWLTQRALRLQNECFTGAAIDEKRLALFLRYQTTHERAFHKALATLMRLQKDRRQLQTQRSGFVSQGRTITGPESGLVSQNHHANPSRSLVAPQNPPPTPLAGAA